MMKFGNVWRSALLVCSLFAAVGCVNADDEDVVIGCCVAQPCFDPCTCEHVLTVCGPDHGEGLNSCPIGTVTELSCGEEWKPTANCVASPQ